MKGRKNICDGTRREDKAKAAVSGSMHTIIEVLRVGKEARIEAMERD